MNPTPLTKTVFSSPITFLAFGFGSGLAPKAPGTFGTLAAIPIYWLLSHAPWWLYIDIVIAAALIGIWICGKASEQLGVHDHSGIVWDEFVGYWLTMFLAPTGLSWIVIGFLLFRLFDIWKPWPVSWADERLAGGLGVMADDIIAGLYAFVVLQALVKVAELMAWL
ncbi:phosphatidylglycerophosphatase A family protein [Thiolinea disciformis]|uniref:phosphatidylglycerophosphatase A family protein n=1 Tax=Thiolinea disciformis TaxID=125614 RepID=UPI0003601E3A|nr:phosphatidylglycerophosphatase A [Thiolinea disciformis]